MLGIDTKVLNIEDFSKNTANIVSITSQNLDEYINLLTYDLEKGFITNTKSSFNYNRIYNTIKPIQSHFGYFNYLDYINDRESGTIIHMYRLTNNYSRFISYKEIEAVTNKIVNLFGEDLNFKTYYTALDTNEIQNGIWKGREWKIEKLTFRLEINEGTKKFGFVIISPQVN